MAPVEIQMNKGLTSICDQESCDVSQTLYTRAVLHGSMEGTALGEVHQHSTYPPRRPFVVYSGYELHGSAGESTKAQNFPFLSPAHGLGPLTRRSTRCWGR